MPKKVFDYVKCGGAHERSVSSKCKVVTGKDTASINENLMCVPDSNALFCNTSKI